jgi:hypothetical protein
MKRIWHKSAVTPWGGIDWEASDWEWADDNAPADLCDRAATAQANNLQKTAAQSAITAQQNAANYGSQAAVEGKIGEQYDLQQLLHPTGIGQQGKQSYLTAAQAGTGGATAGLSGLVAQAQTRRGAAGASTVGDELVRERSQDMAKAGEGVEAEDIQTKLGQQQQASADLGRKYGTDVNAQLGQGNLENAEQNTQDKAIGTEITAGQSGWLQNLYAGVNTAANAVKAIKPGGF